MHEQAWENYFDRLKDSEGSVIVVIIIINKGI